jgi:hypothetical protein
MGSIARACGAILASAMAFGATASADASRDPLGWDRHHATDASAHLADDRTLIVEITEGGTLLNTIAVPPLTSEQTPTPARRKRECGRYHISPKSYPPPRGACFRSRP